MASKGIKIGEKVKKKNNVSVENQLREKKNKITQHCHFWKWRSFGHTFIQASLVVEKFSGNKKDCRKRVEGKETITLVAMRVYFEHLLCLALFSLVFMIATEDGVISNVQT